VASDVAPETAENFPRGQGVHAADELRATEDEYFPAAHDWHNAWPSASVNLPSPQVTHVFGDVAARAADDLPSGQDAHVPGDVAPVEDEYLPAEQAWQDGRPAPSA
jgi:hypothetical protein